MLAIDQVSLQFNPSALMGLNIVLGLVMFGIALDLKMNDFKEAFKTPKGLLLAIVGHHLIFPAMTFVLISLIQPIPSIALGMILVSSCPAGHLSNFLTHIAKGNAALSVSASAISTLLAIVLTPINFNFWGNLHPITHDLMRSIEIDALHMLRDIAILLGIPLFLGMFIDLPAAVLLLTPVFLPLAQAIGMDTVQLGIMMVVNLAIGLYTPPVGTTLFIASSLARVKVGETVRAMVPFYVVAFGVLILVSYVPAVILK